MQQSVDNLLCACCWYIKETITIRQTHEIESFKIITESFKITDDVK
jgi:hypothetical protein